MSESVADRTGQRRLQETGPSAAFFVDFPLRAVSRASAELVDCTLVHPSPARPDHTPAYPRDRRPAPAAAVGALTMAAAGATLKLRVSRDEFQRAKEGAAVGVLLGFGLVHIGFMDVTAHPILVAA